MIIQEFPTIHENPTANAFRCGNIEQKKRKTKVFPITHKPLIQEIKPNIQAALSLSKRSPTLLTSPLADLTAFWEHFSGFGEGPQTRLGQRWEMSRGQRHVKKQNTVWFSAGPCDTRMGLEKKQSLLMMLAELPTGFTISCLWLTTGVRGVLQMPGGRVL